MIVASVTRFGVRQMIRSIYSFCLWLTGPGNNWGRKWMRRTAVWEFQREKGKESEREKT